MHGDFSVEYYGQPIYLKTGGVLPMECKKKLSIELTVVYLLNLFIVLLAQMG